MSTIQTQLNTFLFDTYNVPWFPLAFTTFQHIKVLATEDDWRCNNSSTLNFCVLHNWLCSSAVFFWLFIYLLLKHLFFSFFLCGFYVLWSQALNTNWMRKSFQRKGENKRKCSLLGAGKALMLLVMSVGVAIWEILR